MATTLVVLVTKTGDGRRIQISDEQDRAITVAIDDERFAFLVVADGEKQWGMYPTHRSQMDRDDFELALAAHDAQDRERIERSIARQDAELARLDAIGER